MDILKLGALLLFGASGLMAQSAASGSFRVGAARIAITPPADAALPMAGYGGRTQGFRGIHDEIYVRAIVLDDGTTQAALVAWELLFVPDTVWTEMSQRVAAETRIRSENLLLSAVHNHGAPTIGGTEAAANTVAYTKSVQVAAVEAIRRAKAQLQPARFGIGTGAAYVNINRREQGPDGRWSLGYNEDGPSDKTVTVLRFDDLSGKPIALWINYPVHVVVMGPENRMVTGDLAGATSRFVEQHYQGKARLRGDLGPRLRLSPEGRTDSVVAVWTSGAAGDQNPVSMANGEDFAPVDALGKILGEAAVRVATNIKTGAASRIRGAQQVTTCAGRRLEPAQGARTEFKFLDADPVSLRLSLLMIDNVALAGVSGEVFTLIARRLRRESPFSHTIMVTHTNGSSGYIPNDAAYEQISYEVQATRLKPGCAEAAIVNGHLGMMSRQ